MTFFLVFLICVLLVLGSLYDMKKRIIPNILIAVIFALGLINSVWEQSLFSAALGAVIPSIPLLLVKSKVSYLGAGDIKLLSAVGVWMGWVLNIFVFVFACITALIFAFLYWLCLRKNIKAVPFAPFLSLGAFSMYAASLFFPLTS